MTRIRSHAAGALAMLAVVVCNAAGAEDVPLTRMIRFDVCYVREKVDTAWHIRIVNALPRPPGMFVIVYNEEGDIAHRGEVPAGEYSVNSPFTLTIPADGKAQQYVLKIIGPHENHCSLILPLTDLPGEVYGDSGFTMCYRLDRPDLQRQIAFQVPVGGEQVQLFGDRAAYRILDDARQPVADSRTQGIKDANGHLLLSATLQPGRTYWVDLTVSNLFFWGAKSGKLYLTFDPDRWFKPDLKWDLESRPWWKGVAQ